MPFTVVWLPDALDQLADCWNRSSNRKEVTKSTSQIDRQLRFDPDAKGVDFYGDRLFAVPPLHVVFRTKLNDLVVEIVQVW